MLIEKRPETNDIVTIKMSNGDELIGKLKSFDEQTLGINKPLAVVMGPQGFGLVPFILTIDPDAEIKIAKSEIVFYGKTLAEVANEYVKQTTGLVMASSFN